MFHACKPLRSTTLRSRKLSSLTAVIGRRELSVKVVSVCAEINSPEIFTKIVETEEK